MSAPRAVSVSSPSSLCLRAFRPSRWLSFTGVVVVMAGVVAFSGALFAAENAHSAWVYPGENGKLVYKTTGKGDRIMDFSYAGYMGGGVALPNVPVKKTVQPSGGPDDSAAIQAAINEVSALPLEGSFRGAVLLAPGTFYCSNAINISASGVVLRGSGSGAGEGPKSTIKLIGRPHTAVSVRRGGGRGPGGGGGGGGAVQSEGEGPQTKIADAYVPSGAMSFTVADAKGFAVGDTIVLRRPVTEAWVRLMEMHDLTRNGRPQTWMRAGTLTLTERAITAISGNRITVDVPLADSFDAEYLNPPGTVIARISPPERISQSGIEYLHIESPLQEISHSQGHFTAIRMNGQDCWMRDVIIDETMNSVGIGGKRITLERVAVNRKARHQGASKPAEFAPNGSQVLLDRCSVTGDNVWFIATGGGHAGPIVILNCLFRGNGRAESHQRWSTGMLYDSCRAPEGGFELRNRGSMGSGHGWSMGWGVVWNCEAKDFIVQNPPGAMNWMIGSTGHSTLSPRPFGSGPLLPEGVKDSHGTPVTPRSLYLTQLAERLGPQAVRNIGYESVDPRTSPPQKTGTASLGAPAGTERDRALGENFAVDRPVLTTNMRGGQREFAGWQALDNDDKTFWATDDDVKQARLELDTEGALEINAIELAEASGMSGRVRGYRVEGFVESDWKLLAEGTSIGNRQVHRIPNTKVWKVRLSILDASEYPAIRKLGLYLAPPEGSQSASTGHSE